MAIATNVMPLAIFAFVTGFASLALLILGIRSWLATRALLRDGMRVEGRVTEMKEIPSSGQRGRATFAPIFEFKGDDGRTRSLLSNSSSYPPEYKVGDPVRVIFVRGGADEARIESFFSLWLGPLVFFIIAGGALFFCVICTVVLAKG